MTVERLRELINITHKHGVKLAAEIRVLERKHTLSARVKARVLKIRLKGLEVLNVRRRKELAQLEKEQHPTPPKPKPTPKPRRFTMYDSVDVNTIPSDSQAVAGYVGGKWPTFSELLVKFPHAKHLSIAVNSGEDAMALDVEAGDATVEDINVWVRRQHSRGLKAPIIYASLSVMSSILETLKSNDIARDEVRLFVADYTKVAHIPAGFDACQWTDRALGRNLDESLCEPWFL